MVAYVTLEEARQHCAVDTTDLDPQLTRFIGMASSAVKNYLGSAYPFQPELDSMGDVELDSSGDVIYEQDTNGAYVIRDEVKWATLILVGVALKDKDAESADMWQPGYLPNPVKNLLYPLRTPAIA